MIQLSIKCSSCGEFLFQYDRWNSHLHIEDGSFRITGGGPGPIICDNARCRLYHRVQCQRIPDSSEKLGNKQVQEVVTRPFKNKAKKVEKKKT